MKKYLIAAAPLLANNEVLSLITLIVIAVMFMADMAEWMEGKW